MIGQEVLQEQNDQNGTIIFLKLWSPVTKICVTTPAVCQPKIKKDKKSFTATISLYLLLCFLIFKSWKETTITTDISHHVFNIIMIKDIIQCNGILM